MSKKKVKLLMMGIDGVSGFYLSEVLKNPEKLPTFTKLKDEGKLGVHRSILSDANVPHSGPCWSSIYTGVEPKIHGVTSGGWTQGEQYFTNIKTITIFDIIGEKYTEWIWNMPITWPPRPINGYMISGFPTGGKRDFFYPKSLGKDIPKWYKADNIPNDKKGYIGTIEAKQLEADKLHLFFKLFEKYPTDVVFMGTSIVDVCCHRNDYSIYYYIDQWIREALEFFEPENLVMTSDHGFLGTQHNIDAFYYTSNGEVSKSIIDIPKIILKMLKLEKEGYKGIIKKNRRKVIKEENKEIKKKIKDAGCCT